MTTGTVVRFKVLKSQILFSELHCSLHNMRKFTLKCLPSHIKREPSTELSSKCSTQLSHRNFTMQTWFYKTSNKIWQKGTGMMFLNNVLFMLWDISELRYDFRDFGEKNSEVYTFHVINQFAYKCCSLCEGKCQSCRKRNCCSKLGRVWTENRQFVLRIC